MREISFIAVIMIVAIGGVLFSQDAWAQPYPTGVQPPPGRVPTGTEIYPSHAVQPVDLAPPPLGDNPTTQAQMAADQAVGQTFRVRRPVTLAATPSAPSGIPTVPVPASANPPAGRTFETLPAVPVPVADVRTPQPQTTRIIRASRMIGQPIWNTQDQLIGTIDDVVIGYQTASPTVLFAVSSGLAAVPQALVAVPAEAMLVRHEAEGGSRLVLDIGVDQFRNAPHIDPNQWGRIGDPVFLTRTREFYQEARRIAARPLQFGDETNGPPRPGTSPGYAPGGYGAGGPGTGADVGSRSNSGGRSGAELGTGLGDAGLGSGQTPLIGQSPRRATGGPAPVPTDELRRGTLLDSERRGDGRADIDGSRGSTGGRTGTSGGAGAGGRGSSGGGGR